MNATLVGTSDRTVFFYFNSNEDAKDNVFKNTKININPYYLFIYENQPGVIYKSFSFASIDYLKKGGMTVDKYPKMVWKLTNETKTILGYKCQMANTSFRGRDYDVWFTTEIPGNYFPWKFEGLPGAILSFSDKEQLFTTKAISVTQNKNPSVEFEERINKYVSKYKGSAMEYKKDVENEDKWLQERRNERRASLPLGTNVIESPLRELDIEKEMKNFNLNKKNISKKTRKEC